MPVLHSRGPRSAYANVLWAGAALAVASVLAAASLSHPQPAPAATPAPKPDPLARVAFLAGRWSCDSPEGFVEEIWSPPHASSIMGVFRWCKPAPDSAPAMFEMLTITAEGEDVLLRLRHFSPKLVAKEEKDAPTTLKLLSPEPGAPADQAVFQALQHADKVARVTYERTNASTLRIVIMFSPDSKQEALTFNLQHARGAQ